MSETPWQKLMDELKALYGAEKDPHDDEALQIIRCHFDSWYDRGRIAGTVEEAARHRPH